MNIIAPLICFFIFAYLSHEHKTLLNPKKYIVFTTKGMFRAFAVMNLGVVVFNMSNWLKTIRLTRLGFIICSIIELICYGITFFYVCKRYNTNYDFPVLFILAIAFLITVSQKTFLAILCEKISGLCTLLGQFSLYLYLCHRVICADYVPFMKEQFSNRLIMYLVAMTAVVVFSLFIMWLDKVSRNRFFPFVHSKLVKVEN